MSFVGNLFGGGGSGMNYQAQAAPIAQGVNTNQTGSAYQGVQGSLNDQAAFVNAVAGQNGLGNQSQALSSMQGLGGQMAANNGAGNQASTYGQMQGLANQLGVQAQGGGPNPALAQLNQTTGQNIANQAAMAASQRGAASNVGLMARQAGQQGAATQQQAVGQAAVMRSQQQLAAEQALAQQQGQMAGVANTQVGQQQNQQANVANLAGQQVSQQSGAINNYGQAQQGEQANLLNAMGQYNNSSVGMQSNMNSANAGLQDVVAKGQGSLFSGIVGGVGQASAFANGGVVHMADGGPIGTPPPPITVGTSSSSAPQSFAGRFLQGVSTGMGAPAAGGTSGTQNDNSMAGGVQEGIGQLGGRAKKALMDALRNNSNSTSVTPPPSSGTISITSPAADSTAVTGADATGLAGAGAADAAGATAGEGAAAAGAADAGATFSLADLAPMAALAASKGGGVPGKAKVRGNNLKNDTVPAMLSPGEIVLPRSVTQSADPVHSAAKFVAAILAKKRGQ